MSLGSIEAGGTKFVCAIGNHELEIIDRISIPTTNPVETMSHVINFFKKYENGLEAIGIGSFGPIDVNFQSETYGYITSTPKVVWQNFDFVGSLKKVFTDITISWTTDVNAACYGEYVAGEGQGKSCVAYFTVGTGVGGSVLHKDNFIAGFNHPEMGHMIVRKHPKDNFSGMCPFHKDCLEGMAAGPAIEKRSGKRAQNISEEDLIWDIEADYLGQCAYNTSLMFSPDVIIFGGGVLKQQQLIEKIRMKFYDLLQNYVETPVSQHYLVTPRLKDNAGTIGCFALARKELLHLKRLAS